MIRTRLLNKEVYFADEKLVRVGNQDIQLLKEKVGFNERKRIRLCAHSNEEDSLHEMFVILTKETYIRPHKHLNKGESLYFIEGLADVVFFDERGQITQVIAVGDHATARPFYYRLYEPLYHTLVIQSDFLVFHETTNGPFNQSDTLFAHWSPEESDGVAVGEFIEQLRQTAQSFRPQGRAG